MHFSEQKSMLCTGLCVNVWRGLTMSRVWLPFTSVSPPKLAEIQPQDNDRFFYGVNKTADHPICTLCSASEMLQVKCGHLGHLLFLMSNTKFGNFEAEFVWPARFTYRLCIRTLSICSVSLHGIQSPSSSRHAIRQRVSHMECKHLGNPADVLSVLFSRPTLKWCRSA